MTLCIDRHPHDWHPAGGDGCWLQTGNAASAPLARGLLAGELARWLAAHGVTQTLRAKVWQA